MERVLKLYPTEGTYLLRARDLNHSRHVVKKNDKCSSQNLNKILSLITPCFTQLVFYCCDTMTIATVIKKSISLGLVYNPLLSLAGNREWYTGRHGAREVAENFTSRLAGSRKRKTLGLA